MIVRIGKSIKQPVLYSYFISRFDNATLSLLKESKPFTTYHKDLQEYELTSEIYAKIKEPVEYIIDERETLPKFERTHAGKYGYQEDAVEFARKTKNVLVNFPQGMGKSLTTMKIILDQHFSKTLIVCGQGNLQEEWMKDAHKHGLSEALMIDIVGGDSGSGNAKKVKWLQTAAEEGVDLINIEALRSEAIVEALNARHYDCIVVDEVQSAKGWKAQQTEGLHELVRYEGQMRIALSGTPVLNDPLEFFSMLKYFGQLRDTVRTTFEKYYGDWGFDFWGHYVCKGYKNYEDLNDLMSPLVCYVSKDELGLPKKTRKKIDVGMDNAAEYAELARVYKLSAARLKKAGYETKPQVRALMQNLSSNASGKVQFVLEHSLNNKLLVFSQYTTVLDKYCELLAANGRKVLYYHGQLSMKERLEVLEKWHAGEADVLLLSVMSARYGLNLTEATQVVFIDIPSSMTIIEQAEDRAHRIGQDKEVVSYLLCSTSIDEDALENVARKQADLDRLEELRNK